MANKDKDLEEVKFLAQMGSGPATWSNANWLAMIAVSFVLSFPNIESGKVTLPFSLAVVDAPTFNFIGFFILAATIVAFCQGYASAHGSITLGHRCIDKMDASYREELRQYFDFLVSSTYWRIGPLTGSLFRRLGSPSWIVALIYFAIKIVASSIVFGVPLMAIISGALRANKHAGFEVMAFLPTATQSPLVWFTLVAAIIALAVDFVNEIIYVWNVTVYYATGKYPSSNSS